MNSFTKKEGEPRFGSGGLKRVFTRSVHRREWPCCFDLAKGFGEKIVASSARALGMFNGDGPGCLQDALKGGLTGGFRRFFLGG